VEALPHLRGDFRRLMEHVRGAVQVACAREGDG
jgi:hypothetical protein